MSLHIFPLCNFCSVFKNFTNEMHARQCLFFTRRTIAMRTIEAKLIITSNQPSDVGIFVMLLLQHKRIYVYRNGVLRDVCRVLAL